MVTANEIIREINKSSSSLIKKKSIKIEGIPFDAFKDLKIGDVRRLTKEYKRLK